MLLLAENGYATLYGCVDVISILQAGPVKVDFLASAIACII